MNDRSNRIVAQAALARAELERVIHLLGLVIQDVAEVDDDLHVIIRIENAEQLVQCAAGRIGFLRTYGSEKVGEA